ncbi:hypothetical protein H0H92_013686 [Tricholoma furcatifolium]|nr:hypothetical protein H0H92_013686 [Tricholoma furcatifolium]
MFGPHGHGYAQAYGPGAGAAHHFHRHWHHRGPGGFCRPSRLVWFLFGAGAATWWVRHRQSEAARARLVEEADHEPQGVYGYGYGYGHGHGRMPGTGPFGRPQALPPPAVQVQVSDSVHAQAQDPSHWDPHAREPWVARGVSLHGSMHNLPPPPPTASVAAQNQQQSAVSPVAAQGTTVDASDKLAVLSESTLDAVMSTIEVLKVKFAEIRAEKEEQRRRTLEAKAEEDAGREPRREDSAS